MVFSYKTIIISFFTNHFKSLKNSKFFKDVSLVFVANTLSNALNFAGFLMITKALSSEDYGRLATILALVTGISDLSNLGMNASTIRYTAIFKSKGETSKINALLSTVFTNIMLISIAIIFVFLMFSPQITELFIKEASYSNLIIISSVGILIALLYSFFSSVFQGLQDFKTYFIYNTLLSIVKISVIVSFYFYVGFSLTNVVIILVFLPILSVLSSFFFLKNYRISPLLYNRKVQKETFAFGKWMMLWSIAAILQSRVSTYMLASIMNVTEVSYYDLAKKFSNIVMFGLGAFGTVLNSKLAGITKHEEIKNLVRRSKFVVLGLTGLLLLSAILFPVFLQFLYGGKYDGAFIPMGIIMVSLISYVWTLPYNSGLYSLGKSHVFFIQAVTGLVIESIISLLLIPKYGAVGASISFGITYSLVFLMSIYFYKKYISEKSGEKTLSG